MKEWKLGLLIRWRAWWYNKVPITLTTLYILVDGWHAEFLPLLGLVCVVLTVCSVANYGYALNELYDMREDAAIGRTNAAAVLGRTRTLQIVALSVLGAFGFSFAAAGPDGLILTFVELCIPFAYSHPWLRLKERKWLGVLCDASAAHLYPALLALMAVQHLGVRAVPSILWGCAAVWALAAGLRGILSHQMHTANQDEKGGLVTVVHQFGRPALARFITYGLLPLEVCGCAAIILLCGTGPVGWIIGLAYLAYEALKTLSGRFRVIAFDPAGQPYIPFVEESFYKAWGPFLLPLEAACHDLRFAVFTPLYVWLFRPHLMIEWRRLRELWGVGSEFFRGLWQPRRGNKE